ncbi:hypothetical protein [Erwinia sp. 9145]|uniref:hypothetical protein n=1 Tax=Erwinia sp. 9145 TaxID=1500895 RepID=UPI000553CEFC|nr:hypothetical protein [Erwinia sp. 9145]
MRERGIIFNADMVRAVLDGRKTQTRRMLSPRQLKMIDAASSIGECYPLESGKHHANSQSYYCEWCPFGAIGDRLWVRETFFPAPLEPQSVPPKKTKWNIAYRGGAQLEKIAPATYNPTIYNYERWTPSIHMPRWASRITLEITGLRVERLNSMTESDALAEGCNGGHGSIPHYIYSATPHEHFHYIWQSIYGASSWQANPWVWVIEFRRIDND